jgi:Flp pilus assembly protein TadD
LAKGDLAGAIREIETALNLNPASGRAHYELGVALSQSDDNARAIEHFKIAARDVDPNIRAAAAEMLRRIGQR